MDRGLSIHVLEMLGKLLYNTCVCNCRQAQLAICTFSWAKSQLAGLMPEACFDPVNLSYNTTGSDCNYIGILYQTVFAAWTSLCACMSLTLHQQQSH